MDGERFVLVQLAFMPVPSLNFHGMFFYSLVIKGCNANHNVVEYSSSLLL